MNHREKTNNKNGAISSGEVRIANSDSKTGIYCTHPYHMKCQSWKNLRILHVTIDSLWFVPRNDVMGFIFPSILRPQNGLS